MAGLDHTPSRFERARHARRVFAARRYREFDPECFDLEVKADEAAGLSREKVNRRYWARALRFLRLARSQRQATCPLAAFLSGGGGRP